METVKENWISVDERLPRTDQHGLQLSDTMLCIGTAHSDSFTAYYDGFCKFWRYSPHSWAQANVTHWMEIEHLLPNRYPYR